MSPDAARHDPRPEYLRALIDETGLSIRRCAEMIGINRRTLMYYLAGVKAGKPNLAPYPVQFALECLAKGSKTK